MWNPGLFVTRDQMRQYDRIAIEELGIPGVVLMETAGRGAAELAAEIAPGRRVIVVAGPGNNGGDGYVVARHLINRGFDVRTLLVAERSKVSGDALVHLTVLERMGAAIEAVDPTTTLEQLSERLSGADLLVDAVLGTGVTRNVEGWLETVIRGINRANTPVLAIDVPSGIDSDSGRPWGAAVEARWTVTFGHLKRALVVHPGVALAGDVRVVPLGAPAEISERAGFDGELLGEDAIRPLLPIRPRDAHKGTFGHLLVLAGSLGKTGAAALVGEAAMRTGTGLVTIATTGLAQPVLEAKCLEVMVEHLVERADAPLTDKVISRAAQLLDGKAALALGPGLSTAPGISALALKILQLADMPAVVDADGINILAKDPSAAGRITTPLVLTPHPGEMARLTNRTVAGIQADRVGSARETARKQQVVIVLKGARTVIAAPDGRVFVNPTGNPGMASGGMGDVLTGIIGGLLAQALPPLEAALLGVYLHGHGGDRAAQRLGEPGLLASDVVAELPGILKEWSAG